MIVLSYDPDTILVPSGENATKEITPLWALVFLLLSSSVPVWEGKGGSALAEEG